MQTDTETAQPLYTIVEVETPITVTINWSKLTFGDAMALQKAAGDNDAAVEMMGPLISKLIGQPADDLPIGLIMDISKAITARLTTGSPSAKN